MKLRSKNRFLVFSLTFVFLPFHASAESPFSCANSSWQQLSDPELSQAFKSEPEALNALKLAIEKRVGRNPNIEYGAVVVKCGSDYRVEPIASGGKRSLTRQEDNLYAFGKNGKEYITTIVSGMHYHPSGSLTASIGDFIQSNQANRPEYIVARNPSGGGLSPDVGRISPEGITTIVRFSGAEEVDSPNQATLLAKLQKECKGVNIRTKIADNSVNGDVSQKIIHDAACPPIEKGGIEAGTYSGYRTQTSDHKATDLSGLSPSSSGIPVDVAAMLGQVSGQIANVQSQRHYCTSFEFVKDYRGANREVYAKQYRCTECGKGTMINVRGGETIEDRIASNKQHQAFDDQAYATAQSALQGIGTSAPSGGYSPEIMDQFGRTFSEQGPCSAGLQLEALKNQNRNK